MDETNPTALPTLRTFARDLEAERKKRGLTAAATPVTKPSPAPIPVPQPPTETTVATPIPIATTANQIDHSRKKEEPAPTIIEIDPKPIPPFHALGKANTHTTYGHGISIQNDESSATVITDTKSDRFKVAPSIFASIKKWGTSLWVSLTTKKPPRHVVPDADRRKNIIQRATSHSGKVVNNDYAQLRQQVLQRDAATSLQTPTESHPTHTTWTPHTETIFPLLEGDTPPITNVQITPRQGSDTTPTPTPVVVAPSTPPIPTPAPVTITPPTPPIPTPPEVHIPVATPPAPPATPPAETEATASEALESEVREVPPLTPPVRNTAVVTEEQPRRTPSTVLSTNTLSFAVVCGALIVFIAFSGQRYFSSQQTVPSSPPTYSGVLLKAPTITTNLPEPTRESLFAALTPTPASTSSPATELLFTTDNVPTNPALLLTLIDPAIDPALAQNVSTIVFGTYNTKPFIVLRVADRVNALGGLLKWERTMPAALTPHFTIAPEVRTRAFFDRHITNYDVRLLSDREGNEQLVYGFVDAQTIIITADHPTLLALAALSLTTASTSTQNK